MDLIIRIVIILIVIVGVFAWFKIVINQHNKDKEKRLRKDIDNFLKQKYE